MSYVLWQMVNVHGCWTHMRERKRIGDDDDASLWPRRRLQQIELAIMCLSSCLAGSSDRANERKKRFGWSSGLAFYVRTRLRLSLLTLGDSVKKNRNAATNSFSILFRHRFLFYSKYICACADRVHQLALNDDESFLVLFFSILCMVFMFNDK
jgi:hypothetical protein